MTLKILPYDADKGMLLHHVALCPRDYENSLRSIFLGDPDGTWVELIPFGILSE